MAILFHFIMVYGFWIRVTGQVVSLFPSQNGADVLGVNYCGLDTTLSRIGTFLFDPLNFSAATHPHLACSLVAPSSVCMTLGYATDKYSHPMIGDMFSSTSMIACYQRTTKRTGKQYVTSSVSHLHACTIVNVGCPSSSMTLPS